MKKYTNTREIVSEICSRGGVAFKPAVIFELYQCQEHLQEIGAVFLPEEYEAFLKAVNGLTWEGFQFFGTYGLTVKATGKSLMDDIATSNRSWREKRNNVGNRLWLGKHEDTGVIYCYNENTDMYESLEAESLKQIKEYDTFWELFQDTLVAYLAAH